VLFKLLFSSILPPLGIAVCVIYAGLPLATLTTVFATKYYGDDVVRWISLQTVISTLMSVVTIPVIALIIETVLL
jgi:predicted permease